MQTFAKILLAVSLVVGISMLWILVVNPLFRLNRIIVTGNIRLSKDYILHTIGLTTDRNLLLVNVERIKRKLMNMKEIELADVYIKYPHTLYIFVVEKKPAYLLNTGRFWGLTENDEVLPMEGYSGILDLPIITPVEDCAVKPYTIINCKSAILALNFLNYIAKHASGMLDIISEVIAPYEDEIIIILRESGVKVLVGDNWDIWDKLSVVLDNIGKDIQKVDEIDFRFSGQAVVRYKEKYMVRSWGEQ